MNDLISRKDLRDALYAADAVTMRGVSIINQFPTAVEVVPKEKYDELRESFIDYVCSGITNPAPYCKNRCAECVNKYGWCRDKGENCAGFDPDKEG